MQLERSRALDLRLRGVPQSYVEVTGTIVPWVLELGPNVRSAYKLILDTGEEVFLLTDQNWANALSLFEWWSVRVEGMLDSYTATLIPTGLYPTYSKRRTYEN